MDKELNKILKDISSEKGGDVSSLLELITRIALIESGPEFDHTAHQIGGGPGRGLGQWETNEGKGSNRILTSIDRTRRYYKSKNFEIPEWLETAYNKVMNEGTLDASTLPKDKQLLLMLGDLRYGNLDLKDYFSGKISAKEVWLDHWWQGPKQQRANREKAFIEKQKLYNESFINKMLGDIPVWGVNADVFEGQEHLKPFGLTLQDFQKPAETITQYNPTSQINVSSDYTKTNPNILGNKNYFKDLNFLNENKNDLNITEEQPATAPEGQDYNIKPVENTFNLGGTINQSLLFRNKNINSFNEGGSHSENPLGGIPQGTGKNGNPNLVEQGETSYTFKDGTKYIFSHKGLGKKNSNGNQFALGGNISNSCGGPGEPPCDENYFKKIRNSRKGFRENPDGSRSTHLMADNNEDKAFPTLFQEKDGSWTDLSKDHSKAFERASKDNEVYTFSNKEQLFDFARKGSWKNKFAKGGPGEPPTNNPFGFNTMLSDNLNIRDHKTEKPDNNFQNFEYNASKIKPLNFSVSQDKTAVNNLKRLQLKENSEANTEDEFKKFKIGDESDDLKYYQNVFKNIGLYEDELDGKFGKNTKKAIEEFQRQNNLPLTGELDFSTILAFEDLNPIHTDTNIYELKEKIRSKNKNINPDLEQSNSLIDSKSLKSKEDILKIQNKLKEKGYNLNPFNTFKNDGVDGKLGKVTLDAIDKYNSNLNRQTYESIKDGEGLLGGCEEEHCSEYIQNEAFRNINPKVSRKEWNEKTGMYGDAWNIGKNILEKGGSKVTLNQVNAGDVITIDTGGTSEYQDQANREGSGTSHVAIVDKVNPDGSFYVLHNVHKGNKEDGFEGREYRNKVTPDGTIHGFWRFSAKEAFRPNLSEVLQDKKPLRNDIKLEVTDETKSSQLKEFISPLNNFNNKKKVTKMYNLDEEEYNALSKVVIGLLGQETNFGENSELIRTKELLSETSKLFNDVTLGAFSSNKYVKSDEVSRGAGQFKYKTNFGNKDLTEFGINEENFSKNENISVVMLNKIATDYKSFKDKGYSKEDAIYRAITIYNGSLGGMSGGKTREEWAKEYDVDYTNKVLNFATIIDSKSDEENYSTFLDNLMTNENVLKWNLKLRKRNKIK